MQSIFALGGDVLEEGRSEASRCRRTSDIPLMGPFARTRSGAVRALALSLVASTTLLVGCAHLPSAPVHPTDDPGFSSPVSLVPEGMDAIPAEEQEVGLQELAALLLRYLIRGWPWFVHSSTSRAR